MSFTNQRTAWILNSPFYSSEQRFGLATDTHTERLRIYNHIKAAENQLRRLALDCKPKTTRSGETAYHRDVFLSAAVEIFLHCFLSKQPDFTQPTAHAFHWVAQHEVATLYPEQCGSYGGRPGCLAYYLNRLSFKAGCSILTVLDAGLWEFWQRVGADYHFMSPASRQQWLLDYLELDTDLIPRWLAVWRQERHSNPAVMKLERGTCVPDGIFQHLTRRLILGEYDVWALRVLDRVQEKPAVSIEQKAYQIADVWPPAGPLLAWGAFVAEGLLKAAVLLSSVESQPIDLMYRRQPQICEQVAWALSLAHDACLILQQYATWSLASSLRRQLSETLSSFLPPNTRIASIGSNRLTHRIWHSTVAIDPLPIQRIRWLPKPYEFSYWEHPIAGIDLGFTTQPTQPNHIPVLTSPSYLLDSDAAYQQLRQQVNEYKQAGYSIVGLDISTIAWTEPTSEYDTYLERYRLEPSDAQFLYFQARRLRQRLEGLSLPVVMVATAWKPLSEVYAYLNGSGLLLLSPPTLEELRAIRYAGIHLMVRLTQPTHKDVLYYTAMDAAVVSHGNAPPMMTFIQQQAMKLRGYTLGLLHPTQAYSGDEVLFNIESNVPWVVKVRDRSYLLQFTDELIEPITVWFHGSLVLGKPTVECLGIGTINVKERANGYEFTIPSTQYPFVSFGG